MRAALLAGALACVLAACDRDAPAGAATDDTPNAPLPQPRADGAVTDMPARPGPGEVPLAGEVPPPPPPALLPADANFGLPPLEENPETGIAPAAPDAAEPMPAEAATLMREYYAAIDARDFARAHAAWSDDGRASGLTPEQFAAGFADIARIETTFGEPGPVGAAAGSRWVEVPVTVTTTRTDGSVQRQAGRFTLRRAVVDGATPEQRAWRIASADLRDAAP
ncbi:hypothetical protein FZO89_13350 [Luteimonas viscosa]|uniref:Uncharacterized protein n=1 Tax=Luteimonas viscosa TaxID=1132694 RepID=A0A5D4XR86_9GAMM|nr:hypothetical protein [Luteimonas viscosa]TYT27166.1 hypothetical protein FZO89_13350 [Luteimonas viscosa]